MMMIIPKGSGILKNKSFLINPSAAITVNRMVLVEADVGIVVCNSYFYIGNK